MSEVQGAARVEILPDLSEFDSELRNQSGPAFAAVERNARETAAGIEVALERAAVNAADEFVSEGRRADQALARIGDSIGPVDVVVAADTSGVRGEIDRAIGERESIIIDAETSRIRPEIEQAIPNDADVRIDADTTAARAEVGRLDQQIRTTEGSAGRLRTLIAGIGVAGAVAGIRAVVDEFSALQEQTSGTVVNFGEAAESVQRFGQTAPQIGLAASEALRAANQFGGLAVSAGLSADEAARFATTIVERGADIASLRDLGVEETLEKIRAGLVGEAEPLRSLGVFLNAATVEAKAFELGLQDASGEISDAALVQARYELILEQSNIAAGDFARTSDGLANSQRILTAEFRDGLGVIGGEAAPAFERLLDAAGPLLAPLVELGSEALPAIIDAAIPLVPLLGSTLEIAVLLSPALQAVADVIGAIPPELILVAGGAVAANSALGFLGDHLGGISTTVGALSMRRMIGEIGELDGVAIRAGTSSTVAQGGIAGIGTKLAGINPIVAAGVIGIGGLALAASNAAEEKRRFEEAVRNADKALRDEDGTLRTTTTALAGYIETTSRFASQEQFDDLDQLGLSVRAVGDLALQGQEGLAAFVRQGIAAGEIDLTELDENVLRTTGHFRGLGGVLEGSSIISSFIELQRVTQENAQEELALIAARNTGNSQLVERETRNATEIRQQEHLVNVYDESGRIIDTRREIQEGAATTEINYAEALTQVNQELDRQAALATRLEQEYGPLIDSIVGTAESLGQIRAVSPEVATQIAHLRTNSDPGAESFFRLAQGIDAADLSAEDLAIVAGTLGVGVDELTGFIRTTTGALDEFVQSAVSGLPTVDTVWAGALQSAQAEAKAFADTIRELDPAGADLIEAGARVTGEGLTLALQTATTDLADFRDDLRVLTEGGFADLAGLLAEQGSEAGNDLADELAQAMADGNTEILTGLSTANAAFVEETQRTTDYIRDTLGPEMLSVTGILSSALTESFGSDLDFEERVRIAGELAQTELDAQGQSIAAIAAVEGEEAARSYGAAMGLDQEVINAGVAAGNAIAADTAGVGNAAAGLGSTTATRFGERLTSEGPGAARGGLSAIEQSIRGYDVGDGPSEIGRLITAGIAGGMSAASAITQIDHAVTTVVNRAVSRGRGSIRAESPSKLFAELMGAPIAQGIAVGILGEQAAVDDALGSLLKVPTLPGGATLGSVASRFDTAATGGGSGSMISVPSVTVQFIGVVPTPAQARTTGASVLEGLMSAVAGRDVIVDAQLAGSA